MAEEASAYAVLWLEPDADWPAVERAYKALIKAYHPDREGGDVGRAAEITRAYRELRQARAEPGDEDEEPWLEPEAVEPQRSWRLWLVGVVVITGTAAIAAALTLPMSGLVEDFRNRASPFAGLARHRAIDPKADPMNQPLDSPTIQQSVDAALKAVKTGDEAAMAEASRSCQGRLHVEPSLSQFDRCAAFDAAIVQLLNRDPLRDDGPFGQVAVTGREMSGASLFSDDYLVIDARLGRIRQAVEQALRPPPPTTTATT